MKINLVNAEPGVVALGFRRMASLVKSINPDTHSHYVPLTNSYSLLNLLLTKQREEDFAPHVRRVAEEIAQADIVAFSSMSNYAGLVKSLIAAVRDINPSAYVVWGGVHAIIVPEDAIQHADAACTGEGELAFQELLEALRSGRDFRGTRNFWFRDGEQVTRNGFRPLMSGEEMASLPLIEYASDEERIFDRDRGFVPMTREHYLRFNGLGYDTIWSIGCPFKCTYCGNTKFIENDDAYRRLRHPGVSFIINEVKHAVARHPHLDTIVFQDDSFMALPIPLLEEFAARWKQEIGLPFAVMGVIPNYVREVKLEILCDAGMNRVRMGIQSGSQRILEFYKRPSPPRKVSEASRTLNLFSRYMIPPAFDIIADNPIETTQDVRDTLQLIYDLPRPFTLNLFSLRVMPNTEMVEQFEELGVRPEDMASGYHDLAPTYANALLYLLATLKPPRALFDWLLSKARPYHVEQQACPRLNFALRAAYLSRRGLNHLLHMDFSLIPGKTGYALKRAGVIGFWRKHVLPRYERQSLGATPLAGARANATARAPNAT